MTEPALCAHLGCEKPGPRRGYCETHYKAAIADGTLPRLRSKGGHSATPRERGPASATRRDGTKITRTELTKTVSGVIALANFGVLQAKPEWSEDQLTDAEVGMLARAVTRELMTSQRLMALFERLSGTASPHAQLAGAVAAIAIPRLVKHEVLAPAVGEALFYGAMTLAMQRVEGDEIQAPEAPSLTIVEQEPERGSGT